MCIIIIVGIIIIMIIIIYFPDAANNTYSLQNASETRKTYKANWMLFTRNQLDPIEAGLNGNMSVVVADCVSLCSSRRPHSHDHLQRAGITLRRCGCRRLIFHCGASSADEKIADRRSSSPESRTAKARQGGQTDTTSSSMVTVLRRWSNAVATWILRAARRNWAAADA